jgi:hypothetical protein
MPKSIRESMSPETYKLLKDSGKRPVFHSRGKSKKEKYSKEQYVACFRGYDFMESLIVVRPYIQKRYNIDLALLELLLLLVAKKMFTQKDYASYPKQYKYRSIKNLMATGFVDFVQKGPNSSKDVYTINRKGIEIVAHFYECLSGEKKVPVNATNPFTKSTATPFEKKKLALIEQLNQLPPSPSKRQLFE